VEKVCAYVENPMNELEWIPGLVEVKDVSGQGAETYFRWAYKMAGIRLKGESINAGYIPNERIVIQSKGDIVSTWTLTFEPHDGRTKLNVVIEYTIPIPVLGRLAEALVLRQNEREADLALANIKDRMEG
jgi:hypothetical protein